jgi:hypothetical protein
MAVSCRVAPLGSEGAEGLSESPVRVAEADVMETVAWPVTPPELTVMVALPGLMPATSPVLLTLAMAGVPLVQLTVVEASWLVPSE